MKNIKQSLIYNERNSEQLKELLQILEQNVEFIDHDFPPNIQSLVQGCPEYKGQWDLIVWN